MRKNFYILSIVWASFFASCSDAELVSTPIIGEDNQAQISSLPEEASEGELLIKFKPEVTEMLDNASSRSVGGVMSRSSIPTVDEVFDIIDAYNFERVFPVDNRTETNARKAGLHLWYVVRFDKDADLQKVANDLSKVGEISIVQYNRYIKRSYKTPKADNNLSGITPEEFQRRQWSLVNKGFDALKDLEDGFGNKIDRGGNDDYLLEREGYPTVTAGYDVGCENAWMKCTGDPSIIVAVLDEGVMYTHPALRKNMWVNEGEEVTSLEDNDGNGYAGDKYGYNFVSNSGFISWANQGDSGHGTHVAGTIAAYSDAGVRGVAGGDGSEGTGVKIMSCQIFDGDKGTTLLTGAKAIKYAADNGAVVLQCSWGYNSSLASPVTYIPGPGTDEQWEAESPLEKEALEYFISYAGSPNGVIDGGVVVFASGNESAAMAAYPAAYHKFLSVGAIAADGTPATYTNYGKGVNIVAPGGDAEYHASEVGSILSTMPNGTQGVYGYMDGTSMACPHVSGVVALGLSYAHQQHRHFRGEEFRDLVISTARDLDYAEEKTYFINWASFGTAHPSILPLAKYRSSIAKLVSAENLLAAIDNTEIGTSMKMPNVYVSMVNDVVLDVQRFFAGCTDFVCNVEDTSIATATSTPGTSIFTFSGVKEGITKATITAQKAGESVSQDFIITVRKNANNNGWM